MANKTKVAEFHDGQQYDWYAMAQAVIAAGADETDERMAVEDWLANGDINDTDTIAQLATDYNEEHETWRKID